MPHHVAPPNSQKKHAHILRHTDAVLLAALDRVVALSMRCHHDSRRALRKFEKRFEDLLVWCRMVSSLHPTFLNRKAERLHFSEVAVMPDLPVQEAEVLRTERDA